MGNLLRGTERKTVLGVHLEVGPEEGFLTPPF